jgi:Kef-type K+ transport system membrane component KefB
VQNIFFEITIVIFLAAVLSIIFRFLRQPSILAFIITGIIIGPLGVFNFKSHELMQSLASIGITLLLFMIGLELNVKELKSVGKNALIGAGTLLPKNMMLADHSKISAGSKVL